MRFVGMLVIMLVLLSANAEAGEMLCSGGIMISSEGTALAPLLDQRADTPWAKRVSASVPQSRKRPVSFTGLRLEGVITVGQRSVAIINNGVYRKGDCILGYLITGIHGDRVLLENGPRKTYLKVQ
jgi:hypothetical protein